MIILSNSAHLDGATSAWALFGTQPIIACGNGHRAGIPDHEVAENGTVTPSLQCPEDGCDWHETVRLEGWPAR